MQDIDVEAKRKIWNELIAYQHDENRSELTFSNLLSNVERKYIHRSCKDLGLVSKSCGHGESRRLTVRKRISGLASSGQGDGRSKASIASNRPAYKLKPMDERSIAVLDEYRPENSIKSKRSKKGKRNKMIDSPIPKHVFPVDIDQESSKLFSESMLRRYEQRKHNPSYIKLWRERSLLPVWKKNLNLAQFCEDNPIIVVAAETGSGKTTQLPQMILDHYIEQGIGEQCRIVCTQPRRLAALTVAERISEERAQRLGEEIGYQVRLEGSRSEQTRMMFLTTGLLLRIMENNPLLDGITHVIVDEVHERDRHTDFLLIILKELSKKRDDLRIILMSATINEQLFSDYFGGCPIISISGRQFPVQQYFLEDVLEMTGFQVPPPLSEVLGQKRWWDETFMQQRDESEQHDFDHSKSDSKELSMKDEYWSKYSESTLESIQNVSSTEIDYSIVDELIMHICERHSDVNGSILIFLPGWSDITGLYDQLMFNSVLSDPNHFLYVLLHSSVSPEEQRKAFKLPPSGVRKIVLSTNIAETSVTIPDAVFCIDCGKLKETNFDPVSGLSSLDSTWVSKDSARQRAGRAGRVRAGYCFRLYTRTKFEELQDHQVPELLRTPLEEAVLRIKQLNLSDSVESFLEQAIHPPKPLAVKKSLILLQEMGALTNHQKLTVLGNRLAQLPVHPHLGKALLFAAFAQCLDPILTLVSILSTRDIFVLQAGGDFNLADRTKSQMGQGLWSDALMLLNVHQMWVSAQRSPRWCSERAISHRALIFADSLRRRLAGVLESTGLVKAANKARSNRHSSNLNLVRCVWTAALYPNVACGKVRNGPRGGVRTLQTRAENKVHLHPGTSLPLHKGSGLPPEQWMVYFQKVKLRGIFLQQCTLIPPVALLLLAAPKLQALPDQPLNVESVDSTRNDMDIDNDFKLIYGFDEELVEDDPPSLMVMDKDVEWPLIEIPAESCPALLGFRNVIDNAFKFWLDDGYLTERHDILIDDLVLVLDLESKLPAQLPSASDPWSSQSFVPRGGGRTYSRGRPQSRGRGRGAEGRGQGRGRGAERRGQGRGRGAEGRGQGRGRGRGRARGARGRGRDRR